MRIIDCYGVNFPSINGNQMVLLLSIHDTIDLYGDQVHFEWILCYYGQQRSPFFAVQRNR